MVNGMNLYFPPKMKKVVDNVAQADKKQTNADDRLSLHWQSIGKGQDLILLHGWGMNGAVWQGLSVTTTAELRSFCRTIVAASTDRMSTMADPFQPKINATYLPLRTIGNVSMPVIDVCRKSCKESS